MQIHIENPTLESNLFILIFISYILLTLIKRTDLDKVFSPTLTQELKGLAILTILFGHIGYFLAPNSNFLYPLSVASGVGVNLFLLLSGYGLSVSQLKSPLSITQFYKKRLLRLFIPLWIILLLLFPAYYLFLGISFPPSEIIKSFLGFFPKADILYSPNSPLWYFTPILFYYLVFPFAMYKKLKYISWLLIYLLSYFLLKQDLPIKEDVLKLYQLHLLAFPLGISFAIISVLSNKTEFTLKIHSLITHRDSIFSFLMMGLFGFIFAHFAIYSGVGGSKFLEQNLSLVTTLAALGFFIFKKVQSSFLLILGQYSYEIYLIHWPLLLNFDLLYKNLPPFIATFLYLFLFIGLSILLQKFSNKISKLLKLG